MTEALRFLALIELLGLAATPVAGLLLARLPGAGLGLGKPLGLLLAAWLVWLAGSIGIPATTWTSVGAIALLCLAGLLAWSRLRRAARPRPRRWWRPAAPAPPPPDPLRRPLLLAGEAVFLAAFVVMAVLVAYSPDVWNTEKPMDMAMVTASGASTGFPPHDPWLAGSDLNYYYLGHLAMAVLGGLADVEPSRGYNVALALLAALSATAVFTLGAALWAAARPERPGARGPIAGGLCAVGLCLVLGNLAGARELLRHSGPLRDYDWFAPSRVIPGTINEFPAFSFTLGDLHAHVLALPFTVLGLAFAVQVALAGPRLRPVGRGLAEGAAAALVIGVLYAINSWSYPVTAGLLVLALAAWLRSPASAGRRGAAMWWGVLVLAGSGLAVLPFLVHFDPAARGLGLVDTQRPFGRFLADQALLYGLLAWLAAGAYAWRLLRSEKPVRNLVWAFVAAAVVLSLLVPVDLAGAALVAGLAAIALFALLSPRVEGAERVVWLLVAGGTICVLLPEFVYVRDAFDGGSLYRMNTVFKLGFQAWILLALAGVGVLALSGARLGRLRAPWLAVAIALAAASVAYPVAGTYARKRGFEERPTLDGLGWMRARAPGDPGAIAWLRAHAPGDAVVLEAVGPDYSAAGHARISTFTGRPTVLGWPGHEAQWDHDPDARAARVAALYRTPDPARARRLLGAYGVRYVVAGPLERATYGERGLAKWDDLGRRVYDRAGTTVWEILS